MAEAFPDLADRIYRAQSLGNVEPIEHMVPYPNLRALVEGQNVKHSDHPIFPDLNLSNKRFYERVRQTAHWLENQGVMPQDRVFIRGFDFPWTEHLVFGVWTLGGSVVIADQPEVDFNDLKPLNIRFSVTPDTVQYPPAVESFPPDYSPRRKAFLSDEALVFWQTEKRRGIRLSHYNLLVNAHGIQRDFAIDETMKFYCNLTPVSTAWAVFQALLPLYSGAAFSKENPDLRFVLNRRQNKSDIVLKETWTEIVNTDPPTIYHCPETTAVLAINDHPAHMLRFSLDRKNLRVEGHAVMMGYTDEALNDAVFEMDTLVLERE